MKQLVVVVALILIGCSKQAAGPAAPDPAQERAASEAVAKLEGFGAQMCACKDAACATSVAEERGAWLTATYGSVALSTEQQQSRDVSVQRASECAAKLPKPAANEGAQAIAEMAVLRDEMCACQTKACADAVHSRFVVMGEKYKDTKATESQIKDASTVAEAYGRCMMKAMDGQP